MKTIRRRITYANVMSTLAVFLVLGGASALAARQLAKNTVGTKQLKNNAVTTAKIKNGAITNAKIKPGTITGTSLNLATIGTVPHATTADTASNANQLGGLPASAYQQRIRWATVASDGTILEQSGGITVTPFGNEYYVNFGSSVLGHGVMVSGRYFDPNFNPIVADQVCAGPTLKLECGLLPAAINNPSYVMVQTHTPTTNVPEGFNIMVTP